MEEIDPSAILASGRRPRGVRVDYTSPEALAKAGITSAADDDDDNEKSFTAKDVDMKD